MRLAFRVDASSQIGTGHLRRCLSLAQAIRERGDEILFVCRQHDFDYSALLVPEGFELTLLPRPASDPPADLGGPDHATWAGVDWGTDAAETIGACHGPEIDWVVVDHYAFDARWHMTVRDALRSQLAVIDDLADRSLRADVVIDHNFHLDHQVKYQRVIGGIGRLLAGPRYALISDVYSTSPRYAFHEDVASIGIFMGGVDLLGANALALEAVRTAGFGGDVEIVLTSANPDMARIQALAEADGRCVVSRDLPNLANFFARHGLQIGAGGGAIWERCCMAAPTISLVCADNQRYSLPYLHDGRVLLSVDILALPPEERLRCLRDAVMTMLSSPAMRREMSENAALLVDGLGVVRVAEILTTEFPGYRQ